MADCVSLPNAAELVEYLRSDAKELSSMVNGKVECNVLWKAADAIEALLAENARLKAERDAAVTDLKDGGNCYFCKHIGETDYCERGCRWEWRGVQKEEEDAGDETEE